MGAPMGQGANGPAGQRCVWIMDESTYGLVVDVPREPRRRIRPFGAAVGQQRVPIFIGVSYSSDKRIEFGQH